jgi:hypothetical protein
MPRPRKIGRIAFTPSRAGREFFDQLCERLTREHYLGVRATQREAFDVLVALARGPASLLKTLPRWEIGGKASATPLRPPVSLGGVAGVNVLKPK